jgi:hypothetical protein
MSILLRSWRLALVAAPERVKTGLPQTGTRGSENRGLPGHTGSDASD